MWIGWVLFPSPITAFPCKMLKYWDTFAASVFRTVRTSTLSQCKSHTVTRGVKHVFIPTENTAQDIFAEQLNTKRIFRVVSSSVGRGALTRAFSLAWAKTSRPHCDRFVAEACSRPSGFWRQRGSWSFGERRSWQILTAMFCTIPPVDVLCMKI